MKSLSIVFICLINYLQIFPQGNSANEIIEKMKRNASVVHDYEVNIKVKTNVDFLKIPETESILYFKQPNKVKLKSERFSLLPRKFSFFSPISLIKNDATCIGEGEETFNNHKCYVIKIVPSGSDNDIVLANTLVDKEQLVFRKVDLTTRKNGNIVLTMDYDLAMIKRYPLPSSIQFLFDFSNLKIPAEEGETSHDSHNKNKNEKLNKGTIEIRFSDYKVNVGLTDSFFEEKKK